MTRDEIEKQLDELDAKLIEKETQVDKLNEEIEILSKQFYELENKLGYCED